MCPAVGIGEEGLCRGYAVRRVSICTSVPVKYSASSLTAAPAPAPAPAAAAAATTGTAAGAPPPAGTQFTCVTSTTVQILTPEARADVC